MQVSIMRNLTRTGISFTSVTEPHLICTTNLTLNFGCNKLFVTDLDGVNYSLQQKNRWLKFINSLPVFNLETFIPYFFYENDTLCGKGKKIHFQPAYQFNFKSDAFELREHKNNIFSLMQNQKQIALYKRPSTSFNEQLSYFIDFYDEKMLPFFLLFCAFIDTQFYPNHASLHMYKKEVDVVFNDAFAERAKWKPDF